MKAFLPGQIVSGDFINTVHRIRDAASDTPVQELLKPETWAHHSGKLKPFDEIIVVPQGAPYRAHLFVVDAGKGFAKVRLLDVKLINAAPAEVEAPDEVEPADPLGDSDPVSVKWNGPNDKFTVFRRADNEKLRVGFAVKDDALAWARVHMKAMAT